MTAPQPTSTLPAHVFIREKTAHTNGKAVTVGNTSIALSPSSNP